MKSSNDSRNKERRRKGLAYSGGWKEKWGLKRYAEMTKFKDKEEKDERIWNITPAKTQNESRTRVGNRKFKSET